MLGVIWSFTTLLLWRLFFVRNILCQVGHRYSSDAWWHRSDKLHVVSHFFVYFLKFLLLKDILRTFPEQVFNMTCAKYCIKKIIGYKFKTLNNLNRRVHNVSVLLFSEITCHSARVHVCELKSFTWSNHKIS